MVVKNKKNTLRRLINSLAILFYTLAAIITIVALNLPASQNKGLTETEPKAESEVPVVDWPARTDTMAAVVNQTGEDGEKIGKDQEQSVIKAEPGSMQVDAQDGITEIVAIVAAHKKISFGRHPVKVDEEVKSPAETDPAVSGQKEIISLGYFFFPPNQKDITPDIKLEIDGILPEIKFRSGMKVLVEGHADNLPVATGSEAGFKDNVNLAKIRAESVVDYLVRKGVSMERISTVSYGDSRPLADNRTMHGRSMNRRVELYLAPADKLGNGSIYRDLDSKILVKFYFQPGRIDLSADLGEAIDDTAQAVISNPESLIRVEGHTDSLPIITDKLDDYKNKMYLSWLRARFVANSLISAGIPEQRISIVGLGDIAPVASNTTAEGRATNRRVEVKLIQ